jgi:hypothetical protein
MQIAGILTIGTNHYDFVEKKVEEPVELFSI